jgi:hypothetical protein
MRGKSEYEVLNVCPNTLENLTGINQPELRIRIKQFRVVNQERAGRLHTV